MKNQCPICNAILDEEFNYCPMCGEPITPLAKEREQVKLSNAEYERLREIVDTTTDPVVLSAIKNLLERH